MGCSKSSSKREVYSNSISPQETRKISNKKPNLINKAIKERTTTTTKNPKLAERNHTDQIRNKWKRNEENIAKINNKELKAGSLRN